MPPEPKHGSLLTLGDLTLSESIPMNAQTRRPERRSAGKAGLRRRRVLTVVLIAAVAAGPLILWFSVASVVVGEEFSPDTFQRRIFYFHEIPWIHLQIRPVVRGDETGDLERYLVEKKYVKPINQRHPRWDLVRQKGIDPRSRNCDARLLCSYLDSYDAEGNQPWLDWTQNHPQLAEAFWPIVAELARQRLYILVPPLFDLARSCHTAEQLRGRAASFLLRHCRRLGRPAPRIAERQ